MKRILMGAMVTGLGLSMVVSAFADTITITNASFESPVVSGDGTYVLAPGASGVSGTFNGWGWFKTTGSSFQDFGIENPSGSEYTGATGSGMPNGADGTNVCFLNQGINGGVANIFQDVGALQANTTYTLTVAIGQRADRVNGAVTIGLLNAANGASDVWGSGSLLGSTNGVSSVAGTFQDFSVQFTTGASVSGDLYVGAQYVGDGTIQGSVDNFRLQAIPEPATLGLIGLFGGGLLFLRRRLMM